MPDRHDRPPLSVRPPADLETWLRDRAAATGQSVSALIITALTEYRASHPEPQTETAGTP